MEVTAFHIANVDCLMMALYEELPFTTRKLARAVTLQGLSPIEIGTSIFPFGVIAFPMNFDNMPGVEGCPLPDGLIIEDVRRDAIVEKASVD